MVPVLRLLTNMCSPGPCRLLAATAMVLFAMSLSAQRYYGHDHHVYHPPAQTKHQTPPATNARAHATTTTAANSTVHNANTANGQSVPYHGAVSSSKPDTVTPPNPGERQPQ